jgi:Domain of unknown function (DUF5134)
LRGAPVASGLIDDVLAVAMLTVAAFCALRLLVATVWRRAVERDVDLVHIVMGVSMAGMLTGWLTDSWTDVWTAVFLGTTAWFGWGIAREVSQRPATALGGGHFPHLVASAAMVYMLLAARWTAVGAMPGMGAHPSTLAGTSTGAGTSITITTVLVAAVLVGDAVLAARTAFFPLAASASPVADMAMADIAMADTVMADGAVPGAPMTALGAGPPLAASDSPCRSSCRPPRLPVRSALGLGEPSSDPLAPRATAVCLMAMSLAMAYMLAARL